MKQLVELVFENPEKETIRLSYLSSIERESMLAANKHELIADETKTNWYGYPTYRLGDGRIVAERMVNGDGYLFDNEDMYISYLRGKSYFEMGIGIDSSKNAYPFFSLYPAIAESFISKAERVMTEYPEPAEGYKAYLMPGGAVCYLMRRTAELYDGWWYDSVKTFEFWFKVMNPRAVKATS
jgi:hypothetical protein